MAVIRGSVTSSKARGGISYYDATRNWLILSSYHLTPERLPEYVAALNQFRPQHLHAYPSAALILARGLEQAGLKQERRALRLRPERLAWRWPDDAALELRFELPPGCYATTVLRELGDVVDAAAV